MNQINQFREEEDPQNERKDFIRQQIADDVAAGKNEGKVVTRFPPEPNGYLHIGHAKSICLNFGAALDYGGRCHLRFDDTNPCKEEDEFVHAIRKDVQWLGFDWGEHEYFASDYFERMFDWAVELIHQGLAYVDELSPEEIREYRGTLTEPGRPSPYRDRPVTENEELFRRMRDGDFDEGQRVLRAKIDMASGNINMRDPVLYRIRKAAHHRTGETWCVYPTYDYAHCLSDAIEGITHSLCTLEFEDHRPLYDWIIGHVSVPSTPRQIEFARMNLSYTVMSKRRLAQLVQEKRVRGWDDPRMPTICGLRRRGFTPTAIRNFCARIGIAKHENMIEVALLEHSVREDLNISAPRVMAVLDPLKVVITNYPDGQTEELEAVNNPEDPEAGTRKVPFTKEIYIERTDFMEDPPKKFFRLAPGREVRLRYAYFMTCVDVIRDDQGEIMELRCEIDPDSRGGNSPDGRKVKGTIHWVSAGHALNAEVRLYENLLTVEDPSRDKDTDFVNHLNEDSLRILGDCKVEPGLKGAASGERFQFERTGYFCVDPDSTEAELVFNRTVTLKDTWAKIVKKGTGS